MYMACAALAGRIGATDASRQLLGAWPLMALQVQSVAVLQALDGGTAYGLPAELCIGAAQRDQSLQEAASGVTSQLQTALGGPAVVLAQGPVPLLGISWRGLLACMLRTGRFALSAVAGGRIITPDGRSYALVPSKACSVAMEALAASTQLLLPADATAGWVREGSVEVWRLAADMARAEALQACAADHGCQPAAFGTVFMLLKEELSKGGKAVCLDARACALAPLSAVLRRHSLKPCPLPRIPAEGFDPTAPPGPRLAAALEGGGVQLMEALLRRAGREPAGDAVFVLGDVVTTTSKIQAQLLLCLLAHSPEQQATALAASFAKAARSDVGRTYSTHHALLRLWCMVPAELHDIQWQGEPSPALRQLAGLLAGVLCDLGPALFSHADFSYLHVQCTVVACPSALQPCWPATAQTQRRRRGRRSC
jgi:hypothetical protein